MSSSIFKWLFGWVYLVEVPCPQEELDVVLKKGSSPDLPFFFMITASTIIATLGLLANSPAVIIGAMIIAPLMSPIISLSNWLLSGKLILIFRSLLTILLGSLLCIFVAYLITELIGWRLAGSEILSRMNPNLLDLAVAIAAGAAAAFAYTRTSVSAAFAGIAIAVALVPPLCAAGIAMSEKNEVIAEVGLTIERFDTKGPLLLYLTNFIGIVFAGSMVFFFQYYRRSLRTILILLLTLILLGIVVYPLGLSMRNLIIRNQIRRNLAVMTMDLLPEDYKKAQMRNLKVRFDEDIAYIRANAVAEPGVITQSFINKLHDLISESIDMQVVLEVGVIEEPVIKSKSILKAPKDKRGSPEY